MHKPDYRDLDKEQLIARLQIADSENKRLIENNTHLHRMIETLRDAGWQTPRPADYGLSGVRVRSFKVGDGPNMRPNPYGGDVDRKDLATKLAEANQRADEWRRKYMEILDSTGRR